MKLWLFVYGHYLTGNKHNNATLHPLKGPDGFVITLQSSQIVEKFMSEILQANKVEQSIRCVS